MPCIPHSAPLPVRRWVATTMAVCGAGTTAAATAAARRGARCRPGQEAGRHEAGAGCGAVWCTMPAWSGGGPPRCERGVAGATRLATVVRPLHRWCHALPPGRLRPPPCPLRHRRAAHASMGGRGRGGGEDSGAARATPAGVWRLRYGRSSSNAEADAAPFRHPHLSPPHISRPS